MRNHPNLIVLPGDGIGPEVIAQAVRVAEWFGKHRGFDCDLRHEEFGAAAWHRTGSFLKEEVLADMHEADAVLFGAAGGSIDDNVVPSEIRRRFGLLRIRKELGLFANLRPVKIIPALAGASTLRPDVTEGVDMVVVRELTGGIYFGEPRGIETLASGEKRGFNTLTYTQSEIKRIGVMAFDLARSRDGHVTSVDKANVLETSALWREEMVKLHADYQDVSLDHLYVDNAAMQLVRNPRQFDVMVTDNMFGDILSDCAAMIAGSLGMLPSASLSAPRSDGRRRALYEPIHGSAPDIAGQDKANPIAAILSLGMALDLTYGRKEDALLLDEAVAAALASGARTADVVEPGTRTVSTTGMGDAVIAALDRLAR